MIIGIISAIASTIGIIGFCIDKPLLIVIGAIIYIIETIMELISGQLNNISLDIITIVISIIVCCFTKYNIILGICFGLCIESVLMSIFGAIYQIILYKEFMKR